MKRHGQFKANGFSLGIGSKIERRDLPVFASSLGRSLLGNVFFKHAALPRSIGSSGEPADVQEMFSFCGAKARGGDPYRGMERFVHGLCTSILRILTPAILALGFIAYVIDVAFISRRSIHVAILIGAVALCAFTFVMALVNTWAFSLGRFVNYNSMGSSLVLLLATATLVYVGQCGAALVSRHSSGFARRRPGACDQIRQENPADA